ncbi:MAG: FHA domain-containing protein [Anaerolineae bacterium]|nr:FHA domain-containing protein [Anaerolineae bacterium]
MAFGIVTVWTESGEQQEYELTNPITSVGRQPGNDIVLNTSAVSRYHAQFAVADGQVYLVDLGTVNGTFVNDVQVALNSRVPLKAGDEIVMGDMMLVFNLPQARRRQDITLTPSTTTIEDAHVPFRMTVDKPHMVVAPGARMQLALVLENQSDEELTLEIALGGMPHEWTKTNWRELVVTPGEQTEVLVAVLPPRSSKTRPGRYPLSIRVSNKGNPNEYLEAVREIDVVDFHGLAMVVKPGSQNGIYHIAVQNQGNVPASIELRGHDRAELLSYRSRPDQLTIQPGETEQATMRVSPRGGMTSNISGEMPFAVVAHSTDVSGFEAPVMMHYNLSAGRALPFIAGGALVTVLAILAVVVGIAVVAGVLLYRNGILFPEKPAATVPTPEESLSVVEPTPTLVPIPTDSPTETPLPAVAIGSFEVEKSDVVHGYDTGIRLTWNVLYADRITLYNQADPTVALYELLVEPGVTQDAYEIPLDGLSVGSHDFRLEAGYGAVRVDESVTVSVWRGCVLDPEVEVYESVDPDAGQIDSFVGVSFVAISPTLDGEWFNISPAEDVRGTHGFVRAEDLTTCYPAQIPVTVGGKATPTPTVTPLPDTPAPGAGNDVGT